MKKLSIKETLKKNGFIIYPFEGTSMLPLLVEKEDKVHLKLCEEYSLFDVVLFETTKGHYVLHRIVGIKDDKYYIIGDNSLSVAIKTKKDLIAKMVGYYKKDRYVEVTSEEYLAYLKTILLYDESTREEFLNNPNRFFFNRKLEAYFELLKLCFNKEIDKSKFDILLDSEKYELFNFVRENKALHLLGLAISRNLITLNKNLANIAVQEYETSKLRYMRSEVAVQTISKCLNANKVKFIFLKGPEIRGRYPNPHLRISNDLDIFVSKDQFEVAREVLIKELNAKYHNETEHDESFIIESLMIHIELHHTLNDMLPDDIKSLLEDPFKDARKDEEYECRYHLSKDFELVYNLAHNAKHARNNNFWASMITDSYVLLNEDINESKVKEARLEKFAITLNNIVDKVFNKKAYSKVEGDFLEFVLNPRNMVMYKFKKTKTSRFSYIMSRVFAPYKYVAQVHPFILKHKWAYPFFQVYRWISWPFKKGRVKQYRNEVNEFVSINRQDIECLVNAGLEEYIDKI